MQAAASAAPHAVPPYAPSRPAQGTTKPAAKAKPSGEAQGRVIYIGTSVVCSRRPPLTSAHARAPRHQATYPTASTRSRCEARRRRWWRAEGGSEAMDNYLLYGQVLKVKVVPPSALHPDTLKGANTRFVPRVSCRRARAAHDAPRDAAATAKQAGITVRHLCDMRCDVRACGLILRILDAGGGARGGGGDASRGDCAPAGGGRCAGGGGGGGHSAAACRRRAHCAGGAGAGRSKRKGRAQTRQRPQRG